MRLRWLVFTLELSAIAIVGILAMTLYYAYYSNLSVEAEKIDATAVVVAEESNPLVQAGKQVWRDNACGSCHSKDMKTNATGPALKGTLNRWSSEPEEHLYRWVRNSSALIASGDSERAVSVWEENDRNQMSSFPHLTDEEIEALLAYIER